MKSMTKAEEQIMQYLWKIKKGYMKDIIDEFPEPKPAYTTVATVLTTMVKKGFVDYKQFGNVREYFPKIKKNDYFGKHIKGIIKNYFNDSASQFASFFASETKLSVKELEELRAIVDDQIAKQKK
jgi:BlaI family transcriptional regulator, penicillinase repressor